MPSKMMPSKMMLVAIALSLGMALAATTTTTTAGATTTTTTTSNPCKNGGDECSVDAECCGNSALGNCYTNNIAPPRNWYNDLYTKVKVCEPCQTVCGNGYQCPGGFNCPQDYNTVGRLMCCQPFSTTTTTTTPAQCTMTCKANLNGQGNGVYSNQPGNGCDAGHGDAGHVHVVRHCAGLQNGITGANVDTVPLGCCREDSACTMGHCKKDSECGDGLMCEGTNAQYTFCCKPNPLWEPNCKTHERTQVGVQIPGCAVCNDGYAKQYSYGASHCVKCDHHISDPTAPSDDFRTTKNMCKLGFTNFGERVNPSCCVPIQAPKCDKLERDWITLDKDMATGSKTLHFTNGNCVQCAMGFFLATTATDKVPQPLIQAGCTACSTGIGFATRRRHALLPEGAVCNDGLTEQDKTINLGGLTDGALSGFGNGTNIRPGQVTESFSQKGGSQGQLTIVTTYSRLTLCPGGYKEMVPTDGVMRQCFGCCEKCDSGVSSPTTGETGIGSHGCWKLENGENHRQQGWYNPSGFDRAGCCEEVSCSIANSNMQKGTACACNDGFYESLTGQHAGTLTWPSKSSTQANGPIGSCVDTPPTTTTTITTTTTTGSPTTTTTTTTAYSIYTFLAKTNAAACPVGSNALANGAACEAAASALGLNYGKSGKFIGIPQGCVYSADYLQTNFNTQAGPASRGLICIKDVPTTTTAATTTTTTTTTTTAGATTTAVAAVPTTTAAAAVPTTTAGAAVPTTTAGATAGATTTTTAMVALGQVKSTVKLTVQVASAAAFKDADYKAKLAEQLGVDPSKVVIESKTFVVTVVYSFSGAVTEAQAKTALATAWGVPENELTVTIGRRRLNEQERLLSSGGRRLATAVTAVHTSSDVAKADAAKTASADVTAVTTEVQKTVPSVSATVTTAAAVSVEVQTAVTHSEAVAQPSAAHLAAIATAAGGTGATADPVSSVTVAVDSTTTPSGVSDTTTGASPISAGCISAMATLYVILG